MIQSALHNRHAYVSSSPRPSPPPEPRARDGRPRSWKFWGAAVALGLGALAVAALVFIPMRLWSDAPERTPMELVRYVEQRASGHAGLELLANPVVRLVRQLAQREPPAGLPTLGKGQQAFSLPAPLYDKQGRPQPVPAQRSTEPRGSVLTLDSVDALVAAMQQARPGDVLQLAAGTYRLQAPLTTRAAGTPQRPIVLRASAPGKVVIESGAAQAFVVSQPYWVFENLELRGVCAVRDRCEQAFHVVGAASATVLLNNRLVDFNTPVKVSGEGQAWPDDGLMQFNTLSNSSARRTVGTVSGVDLVGASGWTLVDNHIERFVADGDSRVAYGMCIKGGGQGVRVERNLVVCTPENAWQPGARVGISLGCGTTDDKLCRDGKACEAEHSQARVANNVVAHCNDFGIDLNKVRDAVVSQNTLVNTEGIDLRHASSTAETFGNLLEGRERARDGAQLQPHGDLVVRKLADILSRPDALDLRWRDPPETMRPTPENRSDFCAAVRPFASPPGATVQSSCDLRP